MTRLVFLLWGSILLVAPAGHAADILAKFVNVDDTVFSHPEPMHGPWHEADPVTVPAFPQNITPPARSTASVASLDVRAVHNGSWLGVMVSWSDDTQSDASAAGQFPDAVAMSIPLQDPATTSPFMGQPGAGVEVNYWKALWQRDIDRGYQDVTDLHPNTAVDLYWRSDARAPYPVQDVLAAPEARQWLPAMANGNSMSQLQRRTPVEQLVAEGFGTLTTQKRQDAFGAGTYHNGKWTVVFTRPLATGDPADADLQAGIKTAINFAVWEGGSGDRGGYKNFTMWTPMVLEATP